MKILSGHNESLLPIGKPLELREDAKGLYLKAKISDTALGRDVKTLIGDGVLCELSIGYDPVTFEYDAEGIRHLKEVKLWEISVVTWAMNEEAVITDYKGGEVAAQVEAMTQDVVTDIKAGRKISAARLKALKDTSVAMKQASKMLDGIIAEAQDKGDAPAKANNRTKPPEKKPEASKQKPTVEIIF